MFMAIMFKTHDLLEWIHSLQWLYVRCVLIHTHTHTPTSSNYARTAVWCCLKVFNGCDMALVILEFGLKIRHHKHWHKYHGYTTSTFTTQTLQLEVFTQTGNAKIDCFTNELTFQIRMKEQPQTMRSSIHVILHCFTIKQWSRLGSHVGLNNETG